MSLEIIECEQQREVWRTIPGISADYEVSSLGRVRSFRAHGGRRRLDAPRHRKMRINALGYMQVGLQAPGGKQKQYTVHGLVAAAFLGPRPEGKQVAHNDGDRTNNRADNLRYATPLENTRDKRLHGTQQFGESASNAKLTENQVAEIRRRCSRGEYQQAVAEAFGISQSQVSNIVRRASWSHIDSEAS